MPVLDSRQGRAAEMGQPRLCGSGRGRIAGAKRCATAGNCSGTQARETIDRSHLSAAIFEQALSTVVAGDRRVFTVTDYAGQEESARHRLRQERGRRPCARHPAHGAQPCRHARPADHGGGHLRPRRPAALLQPGFPETLGTRPRTSSTARPTMRMLLNRLRSEGKLAEQPEWRRWKENLFSAPTARSIRRSTWWHLPDGTHHPRRRQPAAEGRRDLDLREPDREDRPRKPLQRRPCACRAKRSTTWPKASPCSGRTDASARRTRPSTRCGALPDDIVGKKTHISEIRRRCDPLAEDSSVGRLRRVGDRLRRRTPRPPGPDRTRTAAILRYARQPPAQRPGDDDLRRRDRRGERRAGAEGQERGAAEAPTSSKNDFVQHVSYELRSPLTNIIGFTELLSLPATGPLHAERQREYVEHIGSSSVGAADHRQRHPRPRDGRRRHHGARDLARCGVDRTIMQGGRRAASPTG